MKTNAKTLAAIALIIALYGCEAGGNGDASKWMWVSGDNVMDQVGTYGTKGTANASNVPGAREGAVSWIDTQGKLWLFGGSGYSGSSDGYLNDLWKFDPTTLQWTWVSGDNVVDQVGTYGTKGTPAPSNVPGARKRQYPGSIPAEGSGSSGDLAMIPASTTAISTTCGSLTRRLFNGRGYRATMW